MAVVAKVTVTTDPRGLELLVESVANEIERRHTEYRSGIEANMRQAYINKTKEVVQLYEDLTGKRHRLST